MNITIPTSTAGNTWYSMQNCTQSAVDVEIVTFLSHGLLFKTVSLILTIPTLFWHFLYKSSLHLVSFFKKLRIRDTYVHTYVHTFVLSFYFLCVCVHIRRNPINISKNRYRDVGCVDQTRVQLQLLEGVEVCALCTYACVHTYVCHVMYVL